MMAGSAQARRKDSSFRDTKAPVTRRAIHSRRRTRSADRKAVVVCRRLFLLCVTGLHLNVASRAQMTRSVSHGRPRYWTLWSIATLISLMSAGGWIRGDSPVDPAATADAFWQTGRPMAIGVREGRAKVCVPTPVAGSEVLVVTSVLARSHGPFTLRLGAHRAAAAAIPDRADDGVPRQRHRVAPRPVGGAPAAPPPRAPATARQFHLMVRDGAVDSPGNYAQIQGVLRGVGRKIQVYVAVEDVEHVAKDVVRDLIITFDDQIFPLMARRVGTARDVDGDGRFTILISSWLEHLGGGRYPVDGFVRVADLDPAFRAPFGNRCDMMYLNSSLRAGPYLRTVVAHEYMHASVFSQKTLCGVRGDRQGLEEEGWLDEALAHLAEDLNGFSTENIDYRISAFLTRPEAYDLVVDDYYAADLFRSHGHRGSTYLFLRWCADHYGPDLISTLVHSPLCGVDNLEAATGASFASLFRRWSLAVFMSGLASENDERARGDDGFASLNVRAPCDDWELVGPRFTRVAVDGPAETWTAVGTSCHYSIVDSSATGAVEIEVAAPPLADVQVTVVPLDPGLPRLALSVQKVVKAGEDLQLRACIREQSGVPVRLSALSWEPVTPSAHSHSAAFRCGRLDMLGIAAAFGTSALPARGELRSGLIRLPGVAAGAGSLAIKLVGTDARGRRVAAWAEIEASATGHDTADP